MFSFAFSPRSPSFAISPIPREPLEKDGIGSTRKASLLGAEKGRHKKSNCATWAAKFDSAFGRARKRKWSDTSVVTTPANELAGI